MSKVDENNLVESEKGSIEYREYKFSIISCAVLVSLISWPFIFFLIFLYFLESQPLVFTLTLSITIGAIPFFFSICIVYNYERLIRHHGPKRYDQIRIYYPRIKTPFKDIEDLKRIIKEKESELESLNAYQFKSNIVKIQKKNLSSELKVLKEHLSQLKKNIS